MSANHELFIRLTRKTFSPDGSYINHYWVTGNKANPPLLLLHGFGGNHSGLLPLIEKLKNTYYVIVPDLPGWGISPRFKPLITIHNHAVYLQSVVANEKIRQVHVVGHCVGAVIAIDFALLYPHLVKDIILVSVPYEDGTVWHLLLRYLAEISNHVPRFYRPLFYMWRNRAIGAFTSFFVLQYKSYRKRLREIRKFIKEQSQQPEDSVEEAWSDFMKYEFKKIKYVHSPIYIIHGAKDLLIPKNQILKFHRFVPNARLDFIENAGHLPPGETPAKLARMISDFVQAGLPYSNLEFATMNTL